MYTAPSSELLSPWSGSSRVALQAVKVTANTKARAIRITKSFFLRPCSSGLAG
jgi:hypothetical protein